MKKIILRVFLLLIANLIYSQTEYLVTVNPTNCSFGIINSIPDIHYIAIYPNFTTFDEVNKRYILKGKDFQNNLKLYTINALTGETLYNPGFPIEDSSEDNLVEFQYDNTGNKLYALHWNSVEQTEYLASLNLETGQYNVVHALPVKDPQTIVPQYTYRRFSTFNKNQQNYIFSGADLNGVKKLFTVDVNTGNILYAPNFPILSDASDLLCELQFDNASNNLYGIYLDVSEAKFYLVTINQQNGQYNIVCTIPDVLSLDTSNGYSVFDETNRKFIFHGLSSNGWKLFSVNVETGATSTIDFFPELPSNDNVIELQMDNTSGILYGLHWKNNNLGIDSNEKTKIVISPNPASNGKCMIKLDKIYSEIKIEIYNSLGQMIKTETKLNVDQLNTNIDDLSSGIYIVKLTSLGHYINVQRLIIQ